MARRVFFSFHYQRDVWRINQIRNIPNITGVAAAGFADASLWEKARSTGDAAIKSLINNGLKNTSVTVIFVGYGTAGRKYIEYEIDQSIARGNGIVAVQIHHLKDRNGDVNSPGAIPSKIKSKGYNAYKYSNHERLSAWIEAAAKAAGK